MQQNCPCLSISVTIPSSNAADDVIVLKTEPGSYVSDIALFLHIFCIAVVLSCESRFFHSAFCSSVCGSYGLFKSYAGYVAIAKTSPFLGFIAIILPPSVQTLSIHASSKYFSTIDCIVISIVNIKLFPSIAEIYSSSPKLSPAAFVCLSIFPFVPFSSSLYFASIPSNPLSEIKFP